MPSMNERLKWAREQAGHETAADAARAMRINTQTYAGHENGARGFTAQAARYAAFYRVSVDWLLTGKGSPKLGGKVIQVLFDELPAEDQKQAIDYIRFLKEKAS